MILYLKRNLRPSIFWTLMWLLFWPGVALTGAALVRKLRAA